MHFVFLAAGKGARIFKKIKTNKCLIKVEKKTIIERLIENIPKNYRKKTTIVTGFNHTNIIKATKKYKINYLQNKEYKNTEMLHSLCIALEKIDDDIFFSYSDIIYDKIIIRKMIKQKNKNICVPININWKKVWIQRGTNIEEDAETLRYKNSKLLEIGEKIKDIKKVKGQFMGLFYIPKDKRNLISAVVHVDGTGRVQTVTKDLNYRFYMLINCFSKISNVPVLLNTSFNENEPIVLNPTEAIDCFLRTEMDCLVLNNYVILRE